jgi:FixJ family two-component response regulator
MTFPLSNGYPMTERQKTVAVVDDDEMMLLAIASLLESLGFDAKAFASAEAFLNFGVDDEFDCLLLDIHLGGMSGFELHRRLKASHPTLPIIYMTGSNDQATYAQAIAAGCAGFLRKPFLTRPLLEAIEKATLAKQ